MPNTLTLYRRHCADCIHNYPRDQRLLRPRTKQEQKSDCACVIHAAGRLRLEKARIYHKVVTTFDKVLQTDVPTNDWDKAEATRKQWLHWERTTPPDAATSLVSPSVQQAWDRFYEKKGGKRQGVMGVSSPSPVPSVSQRSKRAKATLKKYDIFYRMRLEPWCTKKGGIASVRVNIFDTFEAVEDFVHSWRNMNPNRNQKDLEWEDKALGPNSERAERERLSAFLNYCIKHQWLAENQVRNLERINIDIEPKYGLTFAEVERVLAQIAQYPDCYGRIEENRDQQQRIRAFILTLRYTGLRIGDAAIFNTGWIHPNPSGDGYYVHVPKAQKPQRPVQLPLDDELAEALFTLPFKSEKEVAGKRVGYWFWTGESERETVTGIWQKIVDNLYHRAQEPNPAFDPKLPISEANKEYLKPFEHHTTPHTWRHTFAVLSLISGADIRDVSRWIGHSSVLITEKHYGHANSSMIHNDAQSYRKMRERQREKVDELRGSPKNNVTVFPTRKVG